MADPCRNTLVVASDFYAPKFWMGSCGWYMWQVVWIQVERWGHFELFALRGNEDAKTSSSCHEDDQLCQKKNKDTKMSYLSTLIWLILNYSYSKMLENETAKCTDNYTYWQIDESHTQIINIPSGGSRISPRRRRQLPRGGANIRFWQIFPKTAWNWKNLDPQGVHVPRAPLDPPLIPDWNSKLINMSYMLTLSVFFLFTKNHHYDNGIACIETVCSTEKPQFRWIDRKIPWEVTILRLSYQSPRISPTGVMMMILLGFHLVYRRPMWWWWSLSDSTSCITDQCDDDDPSRIPTSCITDQCDDDDPSRIPPHVSPTGAMMMIPLGFHPSVGFTTPGIRLLLLTDCTSIVANWLFKKVLIPLDMLQISIYHLTPCRNSTRFWVLK